VSLSSDAFLAEGWDETCQGTTYYAWCVIPPVVIVLAGWLVGWLVGGHSLYSSILKIGAARLFEMCTPAYKLYSVTSHTAVILNLPLLFRRARIVT